MEQKTVLLCTFTTTANLDRTIEDIKSKYGLLVKIFVLGDRSDTDKLLCTYNVIQSNMQFLPKTILVHRKQRYNTLYTINALNHLIRELNGGVYTPNYTIKWENYRDKALLKKDDIFEEIDTFFIKYA